MTKLPPYLQELAELKEKSTQVVAWYAHQDTVRCRTQVVRRFESGILCRNEGLGKEVKWQDLIGT